MKEIYAREDEMIEIVNDQETEIRIEIEVTEMIKSGTETEIGVIITD